jgi:hypothetical protein
VETSVEVRYAGVIVGRGALMRRDLGAEGAFVGIAEPMPVGTAVTLTIGETIRPAIVDAVVESADASAVGMRVRWGGAAAPAPRSEPAKPAPAPAKAAPVAEEAGSVAPAPAKAAPVAEEAGSVVTAPVTPSTSSPPPVEASAQEDAQHEQDAPPAEVPFAAPLSLAGPGDSPHQGGGGGKRRRKRR